MYKKAGIVLVGLLVTSSLAALITIVPNTARALSGGPDAYGYTFDDTVPFSWIPAAGIIVADAPTNCQNPPGSPDFSFGSFTFYGVAYNNIIVCPNGFVKFTGGTVTGTSANSIIPNSAIPNADIIGLGNSALDPTRVGSGKIYFDMQPTQTVVTWDNVNISTSWQAQFQIIMKDTGVIDIQYNSIPSLYSNVVSGIESDQGDMALQYSGSNAPGSLLNNVNVRYAPPSPPVSDVLTISGEDLAPATVEQTANVVVERYIMSVTSGAVAVKQFRFQKLGTVADADIRFRIYNDTDNNSALDTSIDQYIMGTTSPTAGVVTVTFTRPHLVTPINIQRWLIIAYCQCSTPAGDTFGVRVSDVLPSVTVAGIDTVTYSPGSPIDSSLSTVIPFPTSTLSFSFTDKAPATVTQGQTDVVILEINATVDVGEVRITRINVTLIGAPPLDTDILRVLLVVDDNDDGQYDHLIDRLLGTVTFSAGVATFYPWFTVYAGPANRVRFLILYDISGNAIIGDLVGASIFSSSDVMTDTCNALISPAGFPGSSNAALIVVGSPNTITITSWTNHAPASAYQGDASIVMANFTMTVDTGVARITGLGWINITLTGIPPNATDLMFGPMGQVALWEDMDADGNLTIGTDNMIGAGWFMGGPPFDWIARINPFMGPLEIYAGSPRNFLIIMGINTMATVGNTVGARIDNVTSVQFDTNTVLSSINIPLQSDNITIQANASDVLSASLTNLAPLTAPPFEQKVVMGSLSLDVPVGSGSNYVDVRGLGIQRIGTSSDDDVFAVGVYYDVNGNSILDPFTDQFLGASRFFGGSAWINFDPMFGFLGLRVKGGITESLLLVIDISPTATLLTTVGLEITNPTDVFIDTMTGDSVSLAGFPLATGLLVIRGIPVIPSLNSPWTVSPPTIDGLLTVGEWADAIQVDLLEIMANRLPTFMYIKNDATNLYIAYDVIGDHTRDFSDYAAIAFDTGNDGLGSDGLEDVFSTGGWSDLYQNHRVYNASTGTWDLEDAPFDQSLPDHTTLDLMRGFSQSSSSSYYHPIIEFQIPLALLRASPGDTIGFVAAAPAGPVTAGVMDNSVGGSYMSSWPLAFGPSLIPPTLDSYGDLILGTPGPVDLTVVGSDKAPAVVIQGQTDVLMMNLTMTANVPSVTLNALNITRTGSGIDADVAAVRLFDDVNDNGIFDVGIDVQLGSTLAFTSGYANFTGLMMSIASGTPERFLIVYDISTTATYGVTLGARLSNPSAIVLAGGANVSGTFPIQSTNSLVNTPPVASSLAVDGYLAFTAGIMHIITPPIDPMMNWTYFDGDSHAQSEYKVQVWTGPSGTGSLMWDPPIGVGPTTSVNYNGAALVDGSTYYYRVNMTDSWEWSGWAEVEFRINTPPPIPGLPINPPNGSVLPSSATQTVSWGTVVDAEADVVTYTWQVEENGTCTFAVLMASGTALANSSAPFATNISSGYCWRVEANDSWEVSGWSANWNFTTTSGLNNPPLLSLPLVAPLTGSTTTMFTYTVRYQDSDGDAPAAANPELWIMKGGVPISGTPFIMIPGAWVGLPNDYAAGRDYSYTTSLSVAGMDYTYYFSAADIWGASNSTIEIDAPDVTNTAPTLDWIGIGNYATDGLDPEIGTTATIFTYRVVYRDVDNDSATNVEVRIEKPSGTPWGTLSMSLDSWIGAPNDYTAGAIYSASTTLSPSGLDYIYFFNASDGSDWATGAPTSTVDAPDVDDPPVANATVWPGTTGFRDTIFVFDAANSTDDFSVVSWRWEFGDGNTATTEKATHSYTSVMTFAVNLTVWDAAGQSDTVTFSITIANRPPSAQAIVSPSTTGYVTTLFVFNGSSSSDPDGIIVTYNWNFGDGNFANGIEVNHTYSSKQTFTVTLTVTDNDGGTDQTALAIDVSNRPPVIVSTTPADTIVQLLTGIGQTFAVDADDPDGDTLTFSWTLNGQAVGIDSPFYDYQAGEQGTYTIEITVSDGIESVSHSWTVNVVTEGFPWWLLILIVILVIVVSIILYYFLIKRKKSRKEEIDQEVSQPPPPEDLTPTIEEEKRSLPPPPPS